MLYRLFCFAMACCAVAIGCLSPQAALGAAAKPPRSAAPVPLAAITAPDQVLDGFPVWLGKDRVLDRVVVLVEGFDLQNAVDAPQLLRLVAPAAQRMLHEGLDLLVVDFPDSHLAPDALAPLVTRAIQAASRAAKGNLVAVVGLSAGGIVARWALVTAEQAGAPLPVHTLLLFDCPNRGARINPALQALVLRYGKRNDREAFSCDSARSLIQHVPGKVHWKRIGPRLPAAGRMVPENWTPDDGRSSAFFERLWALNEQRGYPQKCRVVAVAQGSRRATRSTGDLYRIWLPIGHNWQPPMDTSDCVPGSLMPIMLAVRLRIRMPLGIAGAYMDSIPTFTPTESALDSGPDEEPPFDAWYAREDDAPAIAHDTFDPGAVAFVIDVILRRQSVKTLEPGD